MLIWGTPSLDYNYDDFLAANAWSKTGTTFSLTTRRNAPIGSFIFVVIATDNSQTTNGSATQISGVTDSAGNTYTRAYEYANARGAAQGGAEVAVFTSTATSTLASGGTITITNTNSAYARSAYAFVGAPLGAFSGAALTCAASTYVIGTGAKPSGTMILSGLARRNYLYMVSAAFETNTATGSIDLGTSASFDPPYSWWNMMGITNGEGTTGSGAASNMLCFGGFWGPFVAETGQPVLGTTGCTFDFSTMTSMPTVDQVWTLGAFYIDGSRTLHKQHAGALRSALLRRRL